MRLQSLVATLAVVSCVMAAEDAAAPTGDLRLIVGMSPAYEVSEDATSSSGETSYAWEGTEKDAGTVAVQYVAECGQPMGVMGQPILGLELLCTSAVLKPKTFTVDGVSYANTRGEQVSYLAFTPTAVAGWRFAKPDSSAVGMIGEMQFLLGATVVTGESSNNAGSDDMSVGFGVETGARVMLGIQESGWTGAVLAGVRRGWASIEFDHDAYGSSYTSTLTLDRIGAELMLVVGHSF